MAAGFVGEGSVGEGLEEEVVTGLVGEGSVGEGLEEVVTGLVGEGSVGEGLEEEVVSGDGLGGGGLGGGGLGGGGGDGLGGGGLGGGGLGGGGGDDGEVGGARSSVSALPDGEPNRQLLGAQAARSTHSQCRYMDPIPSSSGLAVRASRRFPIDRWTDIVYKRRSYSTCPSLNNARRRYYNNCRRTQTRGKPEDWLEDFAR